MSTRMVAVVNNCAKNCGGGFARVASYSGHMEEGKFSSPAWPRYEAMLG